MLIIDDTIYAIVAVSDADYLIRLDGYLYTWNEYGDTHAEYQFVSPD